MRFQRITLVLVCAFTILLSAVAGLVIRQARGDDLDSTLWVHAVLVLLGLLILTRATFGPPAVVADRCARCGGPTFQTSRSLDRHAVRTCFTCGNEDPATPPREPVVPLEGAAPKAPEKAGPEY